MKRMWPSKPFVSSNSSHTVFISHHQWCCSQAHEMKLRAKGFFMWQDGISVPLMTPSSLTGNARTDLGDQHMCDCAPTLWHLRHPHSLRGFFPETSHQSCEEREERRSVSQCKSQSSSRENPSLGNNHRGWTENKQEMLDKK